MCLGYSWVCSKVKLYHSFKQGWREGSITGEACRFTRNTTLRARLASRPSSSQCRISMLPKRQLQSCPIRKPDPNLSHHWICVSLSNKLSAGAPLHWRLVCPAGSNPQPLLVSQIVPSAVTSARRRQLGRLSSARRTCASRRTLRSQPKPASVSTWTCDPAAPAESPILTPGMVLTRTCPSSFLLRPMPFPSQW